jgi:hypothetical protein
MGRQIPLKSEFLGGADWEDFSQRFPDGYNYLWFLAVHNELRRGAEGERRRLLLWQLADLAGSRYRWDHRFL